MERTLTTAEAAKVLGVSAPRVRQMILEGRLPAEKFGRDLMIKETDLKLVENRKVGRPLKSPDSKMKKVLPRRKKDE